MTQNPQTPDLTITLDQVPPFVGFLVELCRELPIGFRRYYRGYAAVLQVIAQPIRVKSPVRQKVTGGQTANQCTGLAQVVGLSGRQTEIDKVAERIRQSQYFRRYAASRPSNVLAKSPRIGGI